MAGSPVPQEFRKALGSFATGVTIVTTARDGEKFGVTANSFNSVSLQPPMVLWSLAKNSASLDAFKHSPGFAVHILADDQQFLSDRFATRGIDKFAGLAIEDGLNAVPLLPGCAARFECGTVYQYEGGDHIIFVGEVLNFAHADKKPLLFHGGKYATASVAEQSELDALDQDIQANDLSYLVARTYLQLLTPVRRRAASAGLTLADHYALSILMIKGSCSLPHINDIISYSGVSVDRDSVARLQDMGLVRLEDGDGNDGIASVTDAGRRLMIELIAAAKAVEADAQLHFDEKDTMLLKQLLGRLLQGLERQDDADRISRHLDLMKTVVHGEADGG